MLFNYPNKSVTTLIKRAVIWLTKNLLSFKFWGHMAKCTNFPPLLAVLLYSYVHQYVAPVEIQL